MKLRSLFITLSIFAGFSLLISLVGLFWLLSQSPLNLLEGGVKKEPTTAIYAPKQAPLMVSLLVNPDRLESLAQLAIPLGQRRRSQLEFNEFKKNLLASTGLNYEKDLSPWIGDEITLAVTSLDFDRNQANGVQPGYLLAAKSKDPELAKEFLQSQYAKEALAGTSDLVFEQYKGVNLIYKRFLTKQSNSRLVTSALVGDAVLFANNPRVLKEAINNIQAPELSLQNSQAYQQALNNIVEPRIGIAYLNLPAVSAWITNSPSAETLEVKQTLTASLKITKEGLGAQTALIALEGEGETNPSLSAPVEALNYIPQTSVLTAAGKDLNQFWAQIINGLEEDSPLKQLIEIALNRLEQPLGIDLPQDIFRWVQGEYALALVALPEKPTLDWVFVAEMLPDANASEAVAHLDQVAKEQGLSVGSIPLSDSKITAWTQLITGTDKTKNQKPSSISLNAQLKGLHTTIKQYEVFASSLTALDQVLAGSDYSLLQSEKFQGAIAPFPRENNGYFYLDWRSGGYLIEKEFPLVQVIDIAGKPLFNHLSSATISSLGSNNGVYRAKVLLKLE